MKDSNKIEQQIAYLKKHGHFVDEYLEFYQQILTMQHGKKSNIDQAKLSLIYKSVDLDNRLADGIPLLDIGELYIDEIFSEPFFRDLLTLFKQYPAEYPTEKILSIQTGIQNQDLIINELLINYISKNSDYFNKLADTLQIDLGLLAIIAKIICLPLLEIYGEILKSQLATVNTNWFRPFCPLCGNAPGMARLEKEAGQKYLWCSTCNSQWIFARIQCPFCLTKDQNQLRFFYDEENKSYRVYICDNCKRYIKTIDERETEQDADIFMMTQDMLTQYLDDLAIKEGFQNAVWWLEAEKV